VTKSRAMFYKEKTHNTDMKNTIRFIIITLFLVFAFQITSANNYYGNYDRYNSLDADDGVIFIIKEVPADENYNNQKWENEDRYPVYDYRYGYSYRAISEYNQKVKYTDPYHNNYNYQSDHVYYQDSPYVYYVYDDYMRKYTSHECYTNPPRDKVFYIKCP